MELGPWRGRARSLGCGALTRHVYAQLGVGNLVPPTTSPSSAAPHEGGEDGAKRALAAAVHRS
jgi:hypothetical protein